MLVGLGVSEFDTDVQRTWRETFDTGTAALAATGRYNRSCEMAIELPELGQPALARDTKETF